MWWWSGDNINGMGHILQRVYELIIQSWKYPCCSLLKNYNLIRSQFCTCDDSCVVLACTNRCPDWIIRIKITTKIISKRNLDYKTINPLWNEPLGSVYNWWAEWEGTVKLTHWGRITHICVGKLTTIGSDNGLSPGRRQAIIWTNAWILLIRPLGTNFNEISFGIQTFSLNKMHFKMSSAKWRPFCLGLNVLSCK